MPDAPVRIEPGELSAGEIIDHLTAGRRVIVERDVMGTAQELVLRYDGDVFYCDTPTALHRHESVAAMRECIDEQGYASP